MNTSELIPYNSELTPILEEDHKKLLATYTSILIHAKNKDYPSLTSALSVFLNQLRSHLKKERVDLYMYIEVILCEHLAGYEKEAFREMRLELSTIASKASCILNRYINVPVNNRTLGNFIDDFSSLGEVLVNRIQKEEKKIFPIYSNYAKHACKTEESKQTDTLIA